MPYGKKKRIQTDISIGLFDQKEHCTCNVLFLVKRVCNVKNAPRRVGSQYYYFYAFFFNYL